MEIETRPVGKYLGITAEYWGTKIDMGLFDEKEVLEFKATLLNTLDELDGYLEKQKARSEPER